MKIKTILVSQPEPKIENSPYFDLEEKQKVKIDFRSFIHVEGLTAKDIRLQKVDFTIYSAVILTSRNAVDHFFRIAKEMRFKVPDSMKYFCQSEPVALYLQNYVVYRKRKIYVGKRNFVDLVPLIKKYKNEKFLLPSSDKLKPLIPNTLEEIGVQFKQAVFYKTVISDLSDLANVYYDILFSLAHLELTLCFTIFQILNKMIHELLYSEIQLSKLLKTKVCVWTSRHRLLRCHQ